MPLAIVKRSAAIGFAQRSGDLRTNVVAFNRRLWRSESQSNVFVPSSSSLSDSAGLGLCLRVQEDVRLLLEGALRLHGKFGGHDCGGCRSQVVEL